MGFVHKIRGLWRFDGDTEPITVTRRGFILMGSVLAGGAMLPAGITRVLAEDGIGTSTVWVSYMIGDMYGPTPFTGDTAEDAIRQASMAADSQEYYDHFTEPHVFSVNGQKAFPIHLATKHDRVMMGEPDRWPPGIPEYRPVLKGCQSETARMMS